MPKYLFEGLIRTLSPLHISAPEDARYSPATGRIVYGKEGFPLTLTRHMPVLLPDDVVDGGEGQIRTPQVQVPILPANGLRGALRRQAAKGIEDHLLAERGEKLSYGAYQGLHCGAVSGNPEGKTAAADEFRAASRHVFMGVFGGGPRMVPGRLRASTGMPVLRGLIDIGLIPERYSDQALEGRPQLTAVAPILRKDDVLGTNPDPRAAEVIDSYEQASEEAQKAMLKNRANRLKKAAGEETEDGARGIGAMAFQQYVVPGVPFHVRFVLNGSPAQAGLLLMALYRLAEEQDTNGLGGRAASGYGRFSIDLKVRTDDGRIETAITGNDEMVSLATDGTTAALVDAYTEALANVTAAEIESFFRPGE